MKTGANELLMRNSTAFSFDTKSLRNYKPKFLALKVEERPIFFFEAVNRHFPAK